MSSRTIVLRNSATVYSRCFTELSRGISEAAVDKKICPSRILFGGRRVLLERGLKKRLRKLRSGCELSVLEGRREEVADVGGVGPGWKTLSEEARLAHDSPCDILHLAESR